MKIKCPCCQTDFEKRTLLSRKNCPSINNVVYQTETEARNCAVGSIQLAICPACHFVFNAAFSENPAAYNENYDSTRTYSRTYQDYLDELISTISKGINQMSRILEIGCGQGEFLNKLCAKTGARGYGYDTVYRGESNPAGNVSFFSQYFNPAESPEKYDIVILRHVLEHVPEPYRFLKGICEGNVLAAGARLWIEVPDIAWILKNGAFYDITYEHCNYFFRQTLAGLAASVGFTKTNIKTMFEGQYILMEATYTQGKITKEKPAESISSIEESVKRFSGKKKEYESIIERSGGACIWGASGKGVIFLSELSDKLLESVKYVIDINPQKQGGFLPVSGKKVHPPEILKQAGGKPLVLIMNGIYEQEIKNRLAEMGVSAATYVV